MSIVLVVIIILAVLFVIGMFSPDDSDNSNKRSTNNNSHQNTVAQRTPPPNYRYWNGVEYDGKEVNCDWCYHLRTEESTGRKYCSKYPGYVNLDYVCDSYVCGVEEVAKGLANIILKDKK